MNDWRKDYLAIPVINAYRRIGRSGVDPSLVRHALLYPAVKVLSKSAKSDRVGCTASDYKKYARGE